MTWLLHRWNRWAWRRFHMHFYLWNPVQEWTGEDTLVLPMPMWFNVPGRERWVTFWRFTFDS